MTVRVLGCAGDPATRIENRVGEPMANPYLYFASQVWAGLDGLQRCLVPPPASRAPYADAAGAADAGDRLPTTLGEALEALAADPVLTAGLGAPLHTAWQAIKRSELARHDAAADKDEWQRREYFSRF